MKLEVLLSCMYQKDMSIVEHSNITGDTLVINQTDHEATDELQKEKQLIRMISTSEVGLSNSRNMAIKNATGDICLLSDDDEIFVQNYDQIIQNAFESLPDADIITFNVTNKITRLKPTVQKLSYLNTLKIASYQIAFRRNAILEKEITFDPLLGAGSGNGCGEENKFLMDCLKHGLRIYFSPETIAAVNTKSSTWFFGYDKTFFYQRGAATRYYMGSFLSLIYAIYYLLAKYSLYQAEISFLDAAKALFSGYLKNSIKQQKLLGLQSGLKSEKS